jgi:hypothetical protein
LSIWQRVHQQDLRFMPWIGSLCFLSNYYEQRSFCRRLFLTLPQEFR